MLILYMSSLGVSMSLFCFVYKCVCKIRVQLMVLENKSEHYTLQHVFLHNCNKLRVLCHAHAHFVERLLEGHISETVVAISMKQKPL